MPDDNRFAGLSEAVDDDGSATNEDDSQPAESAVDADSSGESNPNAASNSGSTKTEFESVAAETDTDSVVDTDATDIDTADSGADTDSDSDSVSASNSSSETSDADDPTAFPFDAAEKKTAYVRPETLDDLEDARALVDAQLRTQHDVRDLTGREFYDAVFRLAAADTDGLIEAVLEARDD
ncbi:hypothetical protein GS429_10845 [Natronorubrum sp. JWXQ-INN-674]|uniref:Uncharacterized protein n=1 Tax=Natronorubrum halalkaliphilum TaxID=2691917 RepID=A0A6B0VL35_9EURY|nr:hypothetical protein [Natronorubrum halalkaliphilum]MXV62551.1 hypothetical protein [Natronorubrum halalkaliphilum]